MRKHLLAAAFWLLLPTAAFARPYPSYYTSGSGGSLTVPNSPYIGGNGTALTAATTPVLPSAIPSVVTTAPLCGTGSPGSTAACVSGTALPNTTTATTQSAGDATTDVATDSFVNTALSLSAISGTAAGVSAAANINGVERVTSGSSTTVNAQSVVLALDNGVTSPYTPTFPASPQSGQTLTIVCYGSYTIAPTANATPSGQTILGGITTCSAATGHKWIYVSASKEWFPDH